MCVILATWKAEIRRIIIQDQPRQIVCETPISKIITTMDWRCVFCKHKALNIKPIPAKRRKDADFLALLWRTCSGMNQVFLEVHTIHIFKTKQPKTLNLTYFAFLKKGQLNYGFCLKTLKLKKN
jgi:hypothetical protein